MPNTQTISRPSGELDLNLHITDVCNYRCKHCYQDAYEEQGLSLTQIKKIIRDFVTFARSMHLESKITILGGEPLVRDDLLEILIYIDTFREHISYCDLITNGSLLTDNFLKELRAKAPVVSLISISLDGDMKTHDAIRGDGAFDAALQAALSARAHGFNIFFITIISRLNHKTIFNLLDLFLTYDIGISISRVVPMGTGKQLEKQMLTPKELRSFYQKIERINKTYQLAPPPGLLALYKKTKNPTLLRHIRESRYLIQAFNCRNAVRHQENVRDQGSHCKVRHRQLFAILPDGTVYPCRTLPFRLGNILESSFTELYEGVYTQFTHAEKQDARCQSCSSYAGCEGGAPCITLATTGTFYGKDPQCWQP